MRLLRPTYVEVDLDIIKHNINEIKKVIDKNTKLGAVVKANAYGHGAIEVAKVLEEENASDVQNESQPQEKQEPVNESE